MEKHVRVTIDLKFQIGETTADDVKKVYFPRTLLTSGIDLTRKKWKFPLMCFRRGGSDNGIHPTPLQRASHASCIGARVKPGVGRLA
jgi:hypothetical protein